ncbi:CDP-diacylglycerol diphosphatase [Pectobacterium parmentieri]|uniref:CDP-diacylglycerol pyrophosphatase n=1 Tax=Pectobacterium parmentieri TaxID=1905730 RepID=A0A0H3I3B3_PECPM|nr:CDP-diacylglycerol diphosphatase [Pectobacterium parmentieri]AFI89839.1 CDP-diacylglycerol pyrophosphatase [Pectobacterium parmentieri]MBI0469248.1 CDP-diacylglycerol diphosphatase [Pectobacterium parmentieri]MBI0491872.1 CDP-diacylglycerol diphosphatase [Pectobacterium parmentieri]MBI0553156.1 CDP-diacylglycerol diphosphatase [Pectobacterium parmentieri]MBI0566447.1 CDP-diacylglycerol diphosphatase [Pectobacterium parmentieri]
MTRNKLFLLLVTAVVSLIAVLSWSLSRGNSNALWEIVSKQCVPNQQRNNNPAPCLEVNLADGYVLFDDRNGPYHDLLLPTDKISGIESPELLQQNAANFFMQAWGRRGHLSREAGKPIKDDYLSLAINSRYGRTQNQLHIHIACLRPEVYHTLNQQFPTLSTDWKPLSVKINGHIYLAKTLTANELAHSDPFKTLDRYAQQRNESIGKYGLAMVSTPTGDKVLLASSLDVFNMSLGSVEEIQDFSCALAQ